MDLTAPTPLFDLNFDDDGGDDQLAFDARMLTTRPGTAHALLFWWHLDYGADLGVTSTRPDLDPAGPDDTTTHFRCAAVVLARGRGVDVDAPRDLDVALALKFAALEVIRVSATS